jgi:hypothetical protein
MVTECLAQEGATVCGVQTVVATACAAQVASMACRASPVCAHMGSLVTNSLPGFPRGLRWDTGQHEARRVRADGAGERFRAADA